jgi:predicted RND superfamily exporter protein|tara:strand:+ start:4690 stop:6768 length:2079 start_codon:yes stop_codon:yes gene_type:complete
MLDFIWKYKYSFFLFIFCVFIYSSYLLSNPKIFFETERILKYADDIQVELKESVNDKNLLLIGIEFDDTISYNEIIFLDSVYNIIKNDTLITLERSVFSDKRMIYSGLFFHSVNVLDINSPNRYNASIKKLSSKPSLFFSENFTSLFFIVEIKDGLDEKVQRNIISSIKNNFFSINPENVYVSGQIPSELYMQEKVVSELIFLTILSAIFCFLILWLFTFNFRFVIITLLSVLFSVVISISLSQLIYGGIELVMIIMPAIIFIVCVSDLMHLINDNNIVIKNKKEFFKQKVKNIGVPVGLTSLTTAIGFLSFCFSEVLPITRFGLITTLGILISLFIIIISYSICVDLNFHLFRGNKKINKLINSFIRSIINFTNKFYSNIIIVTMVVFAFYGMTKVSVDNYLTDEVNTKSQLFKEVDFFNQNFGGIKPISFKIPISDDVKIEQLIKFEDFLEEKGFSLDFSINRLVENPQFLSRKLLKKITKDVYKIQTRMTDIGSRKSFLVYNTVKEKAVDLDLTLKIGGAGYLFDQVGDKLTKEILYGLLVAILTIGFLFIIINNFNVKYFFVALIPNVFPILVAIGILCLSNFYFGLSNAFIFAIVFGLIVDDSIHILSSYRFNVKRGMDKDQAIEQSLTITARAVIKTTIIVIVSLIPLLLSEFKSVSQLSIITIISAIIAIIFDLIYLPKLIRRFL